MLDGDELASRLGESRRELFNLRFQLATGQLDNPSRIGQVRHEVARMLTVLRAREILEAEGAYVAPTAAEHEAARAKLAAEDAEREEKAAAAAGGGRGRGRGRRPARASTTMHDHLTTTTKRMRPDGRRDPRERQRPWPRPRTPPRRSRRSRPRRPSSCRAGRAVAGHGRRGASAPEEDGPRANRRKVREGIVVSDAMSATVVVAVVERVRHPKYGKTVQRTKKLYVHDAEDSAKVGDRVRVQETRPLSKLKRWRLTEVVERAR